MGNAIEQPRIVERDPVHGTTEEHPAYGQITVSRVSGGSYLYGSDFNHHHYVVIGVNESQLRRSLNRDWHFAKNQIVEVALSEAQWATFVSSFNQGGGVPCTLTRRNRALVPQLPPPNRTDLFKAEANEDMREIASELATLRKKVEENITGLTKAKQADLLNHVTQAQRKVGDTLPFVATQMDKHMESVIEAAKSEVHGYINAQISRAGLQALGGSSDLLTLPETTDAAQEGRR